VRHEVGADDVVVPVPAPSWLASWVKWAPYQTTTSCLWMDSLFRYLSIWISVPPASG
jgi:hypothetical protein